tara:strand:- start:173 stop:322 length:150 start_codon:yes stop_codon:yes gene_type:complete
MDLISDLDTLSERSKRRKKGEEQLPEKGPEEPYMAITTRSRPHLTGIGC